MLLYPMRGGGTLPNERFVRYVSKVPHRKDYELISLNDIQLV